MTLQKIKSIQGKDEYVLLPIAVYRVLKDQIEKELAASEANQNDTYEPFVLEDYVDNPIALARIKASMTQEQFAQRLGVVLIIVRNLSTCVLIEELLNTSSMC